MKRKWIRVFAAMVLSPLAFLALAQIIPKRYTSAMSLMVDQSFRVADQGLPFGSIDDISMASRGRSVPTQLSILMGTDVMGVAISRVAPKHPSVFPTDESLSEKYAMLKNRLRADASKESDVISLFVTMDDPQVAADVANEIGAAYIEYMRRFSEETGEEAKRILQAQIADASAKLSVLDEKLRAIKEDAQIADQVPGANTDSNTLSSIEVQLAQIEGAYDGVAAELVVARRFLAATPKTIRARTTTIVNPRIQELDSQISSAVAERAAAMERFTDDHPAVNGLDLRIANLKEQRRSLEQNLETMWDESVNNLYQGNKQTADGLEARMKGLARQRASFTAARDEMRDRIALYPRRQAAMAKYLRDQSVLENNYLQSMQRLALIEATGAGRQGSARIVSPALASTTPSFPDGRMFLFAGIGLGLAISALILMPKAPTDPYMPINFAELPAPSGDRPGVLGRKEGPSSPTNPKSDTT